MLATLTLLVIERYFLSLLGKRHCPEREREAKGNIHVCVCACGVCSVHVCVWCACVWCACVWGVLSGLTPCLLLYVRVQTSDARSAQQLEGVR